MKPDSNRDCNSTPATARVATLIAVLIPLFIGILYLSTNWYALTTSCEKGADHELLGISIELAKRGEALTGAYSRFGFRHPGPIMAYYYAGWEMAWNVFAPGTSTPMGTHLVGQVVLNIACLILCALWVVRLAHPRAVSNVITALLVTPVALLLWWGAGKTYLHDYWNPSVTMGPMMVLLLSSAAVIQLQWHWLPLFCLMSVLLIHTHLSTVPLTLFLAVLVAWGIWRSLRRAQQTSRNNPPPRPLILICSLAIVLLGILPLVRDASIAPQLGNLGAIAHTLSGSAPRLGLSAAATHIAAYFSPGLPIPAWATLPLTLLLLALVAVKESGPQRSAALLCIFTIFAAVGAASRIHGQWDPYLLRSMLGVVAVCYVLMLGSGLRYALKLPWLTDQRTQSTLLAISLCGALWWSSTLLAGPFSVRRQSCGRIAAPFIQELRPDRSDRFHLVIGDQEAWPFAAPLGLALLRHGATFCIDEQWRYLFDSALVCQPGTSFRTLTAYRTPPVDLPEALRSMHSFHHELNTIFWE